MNITSKQIQEESESFVEGADYDDLVKRLTECKYEVSRVKDEAENMIDLYVLRPHIEESVRYHRAMSLIMAIEARLERLGQSKGSKGYSDKYGLRSLYESGEVMVMPNSELDANGKKLRKSIHSGGLVMANRRTNATGCKVKFKTKKSESVTKYWFERYEKEEGGFESR